VPIWYKVRIVIFIVICSVLVIDQYNNNEVLSMITCDTLWENRQFAKIIQNALEARKIPMVKNRLFDWKSFVLEMESHDLSL